MRKRKSSFMRALAARQEAARQQPAPEDTGERESEAETPRRPPWLANKTRKAPWK